MRILHLSDLHLTATGHDMDGVDARAALLGMLRDCRHLSDIELVVVSGDLADDGSEAGCRMALDLVGSFAAARGTPHVYTTGNHDDRAAFAAVLGSGHVDADGADRASTVMPGPTCAAVSTVGGLRVVTLDSLVPGETAGRIGEAQLAWLADVVAEPAADGTIVVLHHPPVSLPQHPMERAVLEDSAALAAVLHNSDVLLVLAGHLHLQLSGTSGGVPVWVTPGTVTRVDLTAPAPLVRGVHGAGASVIDLGGPFSPLCHVLAARDHRAGDQVYLFDALSGVDVEVESSTRSGPMPGVIE